MKVIDVIKQPLVTEKAVRMKDAVNQYAFAVDTRATKHDVRSAVEQLFRVHVIGVHTLTCHRRARRPLKGGRRLAQKTLWKKAIVTLQEGQKIELFEGV